MRMTNGDGQGGRSDTIIVLRIPDDDRRRPEQVRLMPGQAVTFGRGSPARNVDLKFAHADIARTAGTITAVTDHWTLSNLSRSRTYVVENPEGGGEHVKVPPRRLDAPIPFELSKLIIPVLDGSAELMVFAPQHTYADPAYLNEVDGDATVSTFSLDETAKYFTILVALCEPRLRDPASSALPTASEMISRLAPIPGFEKMTRTGLNFHVDYLAQSKLRLREFKDPDHTARIEYKRAALVAFAIRFDLVREEHLALLTSRGAA